MEFLIDEEVEKISKGIVLERFPGWILLDGDFLLRGLLLALEDGHEDVRCQCHDDDNLCFVNRTFHPLHDTVEDERAIQETRRIHCCEEHDRG